MKRLGIFILFALLALMLVTTASATTQETCPDGDGWTKVETVGDPMSITITAPAGFLVDDVCTKRSTIVEFFYDQMVAVFTKCYDDHAISHYSYTLTEIEPTPTPEPEYWLDAWVEQDCVEACLKIAVMDGEDMVAGPFLVGCTPWLLPYELEIAGPWSSGAYNAGAPYGTLIYEAVGELPEDEICLQSRPTPTPDEPTPTPGAPTPTPTPVEPTATPVPPTSTPPPPTQPPGGSTGGSDAGSGAVALVAAGGILALLVGIREFMKAKRGV